MLLSSAFVFIIIVNPAEFIQHWQQLPSVKQAEPGGR